MVKSSVGVSELVSRIELRSRTCDEEVEGLLEIVDQQGIEGNDRARIRAVSEDVFYAMFTKYIA